MKEFTNWWDFVEYVNAYNEKNGNRYNNVKKHLVANIVFSNDTKDWVRHDYTEEERTYTITNNDKYWYGECIGTGLFGKCPAEYGVLKLNEYLRSWVIETIVVVSEE